MASREQPPVVSPVDRSLVMAAARDRLLWYAAVDSTADRAAAEAGQSPSSEGQRVLGALLVDELRRLGLADVTHDQHGVVMATLPAAGAAPGAPVVGLLAHLDTSPDAPAAGGRARVIAEFDGTPPFSPDLASSLSQEIRDEFGACRGHTIVTTDGSGLLGADDKCGIAAIVTALDWLILHPDHRRAPIRIAITPDEELGRGTDHLDLATFGADVAYTLDGGTSGMIEAETFSADGAVVRFSGRSAHPGTARGRLASAIRAAGQLIASLPSTLAPETTDGRLGFIHPTEITGNVESTEVRLILRDFDRERLADHGETLRFLATAAAAAHPGVTVEVSIAPSYRNTADALRERPTVVAAAEEAMRRAGVTVRHGIVRGGTDGSHLTERGLPCPNLFCGEHNLHSRTEWACLDDLADSVATLVALAGVWAESPENRA
ncbi:MAG TPA: peptidase T [Chloroflexota bacterium]|nr:peptidase T [Chloroflexota bacterium]